MTVEGRVPGQGDSLSQVIDGVRHLFQYAASATEVAALGGAPLSPGGRLTLTTGVPVLTSTSSGATTVYYTPYVHDLVPIYDGSAWSMETFTELSQATTDATKSPAAATTDSLYDVFVWSDSGTLRATRGPAWSSATSRGTGAGTTELERVNGVLMNKIAITNGPAAQRGTYVGTIGTNGSSAVDWTLGGAASGGSAARLMVWNMYNRVLSATTVADNGVGYTYSSVTIRQARASAGNQVTFLQGLQEDAVSATFSQRIDTAASAGAGGAFGIQIDATNSYSGQRSVVVTPAAGTAILGAPVTQQFSVIGRHFIAAVEGGDGATNTTFNLGQTAALYFAARM